MSDGINITRLNGEIEQFGEVVLENGVLQEIAEAAEKHRVMITISVSPYDPEDE